MAEVHNNIFLRGLRGKLAGQIALRTLRDGRTVVCKIPDFSNRKLSKEQKNHHKRVKLASAYAKGASRSNPIYAELAEGTMKNAYNVAFGDWFHPPVIHEVQRQDNVIRVQASDDVSVASVRVLVLDVTGKVLERGASTSSASTGSGWWEYTPSAEGKVVIEVRDLAGNVVKAEA